MQTFISKMSSSTKISAQRILLQQNVSNLFAANVSYHKDCYHSFCSPCWERSQKSKSDKITHDDESTEFFKLISYHITVSHEIYTLAQLRKAYDEFTKGTRLRRLDLKELLIAKLGNNFKDYIFKDYIFKDFRICTLIW